MESLEELKQQKDKAVMKTFWLAFSLAGVFGVPAAIGAVVGTFLDRHFGTRPVITLILLAIALIVSWVVVIRWYQTSKKTIQELNEKIKNFTEYEYFSNSARDFPNRANYYISCL